MYGARGRIGDVARERFREPGGPATSPTHDPRRQVMKMVQVLLQHKVKDYETWLPKFRDHGKVRREYGCEGATVQRALDDPNDVIILFRWQTAGGFRDFMEKSDLKEAMADAGVLTQPVITLLTDGTSYDA